MDICLRLLKESKKSRFDSYSVRNSVLIISHITFRDCRVHFFSDNLSRSSCIHMGFTKWLSRPRAKAKALAEFQKRFPNAYVRQFTTEVEFDDKKHAAGEVEFKARPEWLQNPDDVGENNWSRALRVALGFGNFPYQLMLNKNVAVVNFSNSVASVGGLWNREQ